MRAGNCTENFTWFELACKYGENYFDVPVEYMANATSVCEQMEILRSTIDTPIKIHRCYSTPERNASIGGAQRSFHLRAAALDVSAAGFTPKQLHEVIEELISHKKMQQGGLGLYKTHIHYDNRGKRVRWSR